MVIFIAPYEAPQPLDQTDLNVSSSLLLKGGGGRIGEVEADWLSSLGGRPTYWGRNPWSLSGGPHASGGGSSSLLDCS